VSEIKFSGELLGQIIKRRKIKRVDLAKKIGVTRESIDNWVNQGTPPSSINMARLCELFDVDHSVFFVHEDGSRVYSSSELSMEIQKKRLIKLMDLVSYTALEMKCFLEGEE